MMFFYQNLKAIRGEFYAHSAQDENVCGIEMSKAFLDFYRSASRGCSASDGRGFNLKENQ